MKPAPQGGDKRFMSQVNSQLRAIESELQYIRGDMAELRSKVFHLEKEIDRLKESTRKNNIDHAY